MSQLSGALSNSDAELQSFLGQFDTVIQAYNRFLVDKPPSPQKQQQLQRLQQLQQQQEEFQLTAAHAKQPVPSPQKATDARQCRSCLHSVTAADRFCSQCGATLQHEPSPRYRDDSTVITTTTTYSSVNGAAPAASSAVPPSRPAVAAGGGVGGPAAAAAPPSASATPLPPGSFDIELVRALMEERQRLLGNAKPTPPDSPPPPPPPLQQPHQQQRAAVSRAPTSALAGSPMRSKSAPRGRSGGGGGDGSSYIDTEFLNRNISFDSRTSRGSGRSLSRGRSRGTDASRVSNTSTVSSVASEKQRMRERNKTDTTLTSGYFLPDDLRGPGTFARSKRFDTPMGFRDDNHPHYFLDDRVSGDIREASRRHARSSSEARRSASTRNRGNRYCNVTSQWGIDGDAGGGNTPGPGAYQPRPSKRC